MRCFFGLILVLFGIGVQGRAQSCTGLCLQQVTCPGGGTTSISGTVYAPNGTDPLPNIQVFIPNAPVDPFTAGVSCPVVGQAPSGSPLVGTTTAVDGTFTITNVPVGSNIPLVVQTGRWRRQVVVPATAACANTAFSTRLPRNQSEGDIPKFAISTGREDSVECVLRKVGVDDAEFTDPGGTGRINLYQAEVGGGAVVDGTTPSAAGLMGNLTTLNQFDVLMLPCEGGANVKPAGELGNLISFANAGGRVYASHFGYEWMYQNASFAGVVNWQVHQANPTPDPGTATVDTTFSEGATLAQWLQVVGGSTTQGQVTISTLRHDFNGVIAPTQSWLTLNSPTLGNPVMQFTFNTPVGVTGGQCGRVLYNEYHVENPASATTNKVFPAECSSAPITPQEKLLEFSLFDLTSDGGAPTLTPASADFGSEPVGLTTAAQKFIWTNNSIFASSVTSVPVTGDYAVTGNSCGSVAAGATCEIDVVFTPTAVGTRAGVLTVVSSGKTITAALTGVGVADLTLSPALVTFGNTDVGAVSSAQILTLTNSTPGAIPLGAPSVSGDFAVTTTCGSSLAGGASCAYNVTFKPTQTGARTGLLLVNSSNAAYAAVSSGLSGNGVDFSIVAVPASGSVIAGLPLSMSVTTTPIAGFAAAVSLSCTMTSAASTCTPAALSITPVTAVTTAVALTTTAQYVVVGYGGVFWIVGLGTGCLLWWRRRTVGRLGRCFGMLAVVGALGVAMGGCSGKTPAQNALFTAPGAYTVTVTATDGFLVHSATYAMTVTAK